MSSSDPIEKLKLEDDQSGSLEYVDGERLRLGTGENRMGSSHDIDGEELKSGDQLGCSKCVIDKGLNVGGDGLGSSHPILDEGLES